MRLATKIVTILVLAALATPVAFFLGCGSENPNCGGCPADSAAPFGATIEGPDDQSYAVAPDSSWCISNLTFTVLDPVNILPMNDICVEIFTNGFVALSDAAGDCTVNTNYTGFIRTRTNSAGTVTLDFLTDVLDCGTTTGEDKDIGFFVQIDSCSSGALWNGTWTISCP